MYFKVDQCCIYVCTSKFEHNWRRLDSQQIHHKITLKIVKIIFKVINYNLVIKVSKSCILLIKKNVNFQVSLYIALCPKEVIIV